MALPSRWQRLASQGTSIATGTGDTLLNRVLVNTASTGSSVVLMNNAGASIIGGFTSTSKSVIIGKIDCGSTSQRAMDYGDLFIEGGLVVFMTGTGQGSADVTITYK